MEDSDLANAMLHWLPGQSPAAWHAVAVNWNWDQTLVPLRWIVEQSQCDRATAALVFWRSGPDYALQRSTLRDDMNDPGWLARTILRRWRQGLYGTVRFRFSPEEEGVSAGLLAAMATIPDGPVPESLAAAVDGAETTSYLHEGIPPEVERLISSDDDADDRYL